jgi:GntR family transcriptional regulator
VTHRRRPRYLAIADALRARIGASSRTGGERLPSEHALRAQFGVSRMTVRHALDVLRQEGLLSRHVGRGTFISKAVGGRPLRVIGSVEDMLALGDETWFKPIETATMLAPPSVAEALKLDADTRVVRITGVRHGDEGAFQHVTAYVPERIGRHLLDTDLSRTSVIGTVERCLGSPVTLIEQGIEGVRCPKAVAALLGARAGAPILRFRRTYLTAAGDPVEHAVTYQHSARSPYTVVLHRAEQWRR